MPESYGIFALYALTIFHFMRE